MTSLTNDDKILIKNITVRKRVDALTMVQEFPSQKNGREALYVI